MNPFEWFGKIVKKQHKAGSTATDDTRWALREILFGSELRTGVVNPSKHRRSGRARMKRRHLQRISRDSRRRNQHVA